MDHILHTINVTDADGQMQTEHFDWADVNDFSLTIQRRNDKKFWCVKVNGNDPIQFEYLTESTAATLLEDLMIAKERYKTTQRNKTL